MSENNHHIKPIVPGSLYNLSSGLVMVLRQAINEDKCPWSGHRTVGEMWEIEAGTSTAVSYDPNWSLTTVKWKVTDYWLVLKSDGTLGLINRCHLFERQLSSED